MSRGQLTRCHACGHYGAHSLRTCLNATAALAKIPASPVAEPRAGIPWWVIVLGLLTLGFGFAAWLWKGPEDK
jgi:hypothetical protein